MVKEGVIYKLSVFALWGLSLCVALSFMDKQYWIFELFSHFLPIYVFTAVLLTLFFLMNQYNRAGVVAFILMVITGFQLLPLYIGYHASAKAPKLTILQWNVLYTSQGFAQKTNWLKQQAKHADIMVLQEVTADWLKPFEELRRHFPYQHVIYAAKAGERPHQGAAILSKHPWSEVQTRGSFGYVDVPYLRAVLTVSGGKQLVLYGIHPPPPTSSDDANVRNKNLMDVALAMAKETADYRVIVGDFNSTRYSFWFAHMLRLTGMRDSFEGKGLHTTWPGWLPGFMGITIDQMLISTNLGVLTKAPIDYIVSDHKPVYTTLTLQ